MIITKKIIIKGNSKNLKSLKDKGYNVEINKEIEIDIKDLSKNSHYLVNVECDICHSIKNISYHSYTRNIEKYNFYSCSCCSINKNKKTNIEKYGVSFPTQSKDVINKRKENNIVKYGVDEPSKLSENIRKIKLTKKEKYGNENYNNIKKIKETKKEKYGNENFNNKIKCEETNMHKYGVNNVSQIIEIKEKKKQTFLINYGVDNYTKSNIYKEKNIQYLLDKYQDININKIENDKLYLICNICNTEYIIDRYILRNRILHKTILCTNCNPINSFSTSGKETQLLNFIKENYTGEILENSRNIIKPYELDIYLPNLNLAFEFNGLYWHNELNKPKNYHLNKSNLCNEKNIQLIHIWEDDWAYKQEIVKSMILNKLYKTPNKIFARNCQIKEISDDKLIKEFLNKNHIQGFIRSDINIGLYFNNELVSLMTLTKIKLNDYELLKFCNKLNTIVIGSASKLFKYFIKNYKFIEIITYADRSYSNGNLYKQLGFNFLNNTEINYYYIINKIKYYIKDVCDEKRIYDSGSLKYLYRLTEQL